jgi:DUF4097 and DUF4098 domain-containing protein YvlB
MRILNRSRLLVLLAAMAATSRAEEWSKRFETGLKPVLRVDSAEASVVIKTADRDDIDAHVSTVGWKISDSELRILENHSGNVLELEIHTPKMKFGFAKRTAKLELAVPRETKAEVRTSAGAISVENLKGPTILMSDSAGISAIGMSGKLEASTRDGKIVIRGNVDPLTLSTSLGGVEADLTAGCRMTAPWRIRSGNGNITLRLPPSVSADLDARTEDGKVSVDMPVSFVGTPHSNELHGKINGGGESLIIRVIDGNIRLEKSDQ